jgi:Cu(I)/Ag(I) efflux system protein CusF
MTCFRNTLFTSLLAATALASPAIAQQSQHAGHAMKMTDPSRAQHMYEATGTIVAIDVANRKVGLNHGPIAALKWPAMKMAFSVNDVVDISDLQPGDQVQFTLHRADTGPYPIVEICPTTATEVVPDLCTNSPSPSAREHNDMSPMDYSKMTTEAAQ